MIGAADLDLRLAVFDWLTEQLAREGEVLRWATLRPGAVVRDRRVHLIGPQGIFKPAGFELPLSITTSPRSPYGDSFESDGVLRYAYRGTDPRHPDNAGLRQAMRDRVPLVYFHGVEKGAYLATFPVFIVADDPASLFFRVQADALWAVVKQATLAGTLAVAEDEPEARRAYVTASVRRRLHQAAFRERVLRAYRQMCSLCRLRHTSLLDAAHITPDLDPDGDPVVSNGLALCRLHHAAFDQFFFAVTPDYRVEVRASILEESDGPMLVVGLQQIHGQSIELPTRPAQRPDLDRLARRYDLFRQAS